MRKADASRRRPVEQRRDDRARLRDEGDVALERRQMREGSVQPDARHHRAETVRTDDAHERRLRRFQHPGLKRLAFGAELSEARGDDDGRARAALAQFGNDVGDALRWRGDDGEVRRLRQVADSCDRGYPFHLPAIVRGPLVHRPDLPREAGGVQVFQQNLTDAPLPGARPDEGNRAGAEHLVEISNGHARRDPGRWEIIWRKIAVSSPLNGSVRL